MPTLHLESILDVENKGLHVAVSDPHESGRSVSDVRAGGHDNPHRLPGIVDVSGDKERLTEPLVEGDVVDAGDILVTDKTDHTLHLQRRLGIHLVNVAVCLSRQHKGSVELLWQRGLVIDVFRLTTALDQGLQLGHTLVDWEETGVLLVLLYALLQGSLELDI